MTDQKCDPLLGGIYEYCRTAKHRSVWTQHGSKEDTKITDLKTFEFEFHKKRSFLSEILQTTDMTCHNIQKYGNKYANPGSWFSPKYSWKKWGDWVVELPVISSNYHYKNYQDDNDSMGFHRNEWNNDSEVSHTSYNNSHHHRFYNTHGTNRWELMDHVHFFTQKLFYQWKWNVRCAALRGEKEVLLGEIPLYHENLIPFLFGCSFGDGSPLLHRYGLESVFHRVIRSLRREQFGLILLAGSHEMVIRYSDIRVREERGITWDSLIQEFLSLIRDELPNHKIEDQRQQWSNTIPGRRVPGLVLEWWVSWGEFWGTSAQTPVPWIQSPVLVEEKSKDDDNWSDEIGDEQDQEENDTDGS